MDKQRHRIWRNHGEFWRSWGLRASWAFLLLGFSLERRFGKNIGLYRDDGLVALSTTSGRLADTARKDLIGMFENFGLVITAQANLKSVNFLDITLDLSNGKFKPYRNPNNDPLYINRLSNHPPPILRQLPSSINERINIVRRRNVRRSLHSLQWRSQTIQVSFSPWFLNKIWDIVTNTQLLQDFEQRKNRSSDDKCIIPEQYFVRYFANGNN